MKLIVVTGSVGTGKTKLSKNLAEKLNLYYLDINKIIKKYSISDGFDKKRKSKIIDVEKLNKALVKEINYYEKSIKKNSMNISKKNNIKKNKKLNKVMGKKGIIIDSHLSHHLPKRYVDLCIVTKCNLKTLEKRLKIRKYSKDKVRENMDVEIFDVCLNEAKEKKHNILIVDTSKRTNIKRMINKIVMN